MGIETKRCPSCDSLVASGNRICEVCNQALVSICSKCGHDVVVWNDACSYCGSPVEHLIEKSSQGDSSRQNVEILRLQAEIRTLEHRVQSKPGLVVPLIKAFVLLLVNLAVLAGIIGGCVAIVFHFREADILEYYSNWRTRSNIVLGAAGVAVLAFALSLISGQIRSFRRSAQRASESWINAKQRLDEARKRLERLQQGAG